MSPVPRDLPEGPSEEVLGIRDPLALANEIRYLPTSALDGITPETLTSAARRCRAASYSLLTAARRFEHRADLLADRPQQAERPMDETPADPGGSES